MQRVRQTPREARDKGNSLIIFQMITAKLKGQNIAIAVGANAERRQRRIPQPE